MVRSLSLGVILLAAIQAMAQDTPADTSGFNERNGMQAPPPVSGQAFSTQVGSEVRMNYLSMGLGTVIAYDNNLVAGYGSKPLSEWSYTVWPTITVDKNTRRALALVTYTPGFTFYEPTSSFNESDQNLSGNVQYRMAEHTIVSVQDAFLKSSSIYNAPYAFTGGSVSGSGPSQVTGVIVPFANRISNASTAEVTSQTGEHTMIGGSGTFGELDYPNAAQAPGLYNSDSVSGSGFYNQRISTNQYLGATYQYSQIDAYPQNVTSETTSNTILPFYTIYLKNSETGTLSLSATAGPEYYSATQTGVTQLNAWAPSGTASLGWQGRRTNFATSYSHLVTAGGGLSGAYREDDAKFFARWELTHEWRLNLALAYANNKNITPLFPFSEPGGHALSGTLVGEHPLTRDLMMEVGYDRLHEDYSSISTIASSPDSDRVYISLTYRLTRPLGR